jgi:hypothetical protein
VLLDYVAELATEEYLLEPADQAAEVCQNTWSLGASPEERAGLTTESVVAAFEAVARSLDARLRGPATFYVWHDRQAGALKSSLTSLGTDELPFGAEYEPCSELGPIVEEFLADPSPGFVAWSALEPGSADEPDPPFPPLSVWVRTIS